jgi:pyruvate kinase
MIRKKTKVVCTIGPASESVRTLEKMIRAGMNVARMNFSHGSYEDFEKQIRNIRTASKNTGIPVAIMQDLQGPKIRVGELPEKGILLKNGASVVLTVRPALSTPPALSYPRAQSSSFEPTASSKLVTSSKPATPATIPVQYKNLPRDVKKNDRILLCDGMLELRVEKIAGTDITCRVVTGGLVQTHKGINVPTASISANPITDKDKEDLIFGLKNDVDYVALSFVKNAKNIAELRDLIRHHRGRAKIIAKIERHEAIKNMEEIIHEADGVMVARGDMGVEIPPEKVPVIQKKLIRMANLHGKPVITATEMLQSMIENPRGTRAEVSDVANAVFDHTDAIMLSNESAVGKYPVKATLTLSKVAAATEKEIQKHYHLLPARLFHDNQPLSYATCEAACELAKNTGARLVVAVTLSGFTAQHIAKHRLYIPVIAITEDPKVQQQLQLVWGIGKVLIHKLDFNRHISRIRKLLIAKKLVKPKDRVVVVTNASSEEKLISTIII